MNILLRLPVGSNPIESERVKLENDELKLPWHAKVFKYNCPTILVCGQTEEEVKQRVKTVMPHKRMGPNGPIDFFKIIKRGN